MSFPSLELSLGKRRVRFVDRLREVELLLALLEKGYAFPVVIYGPEGCGKTTLLRYLGLALSTAYQNAVFLYVDALEEHDLKRALTHQDDLLWSIAESLVRESPVGKHLALCVMRILREYAQKRALRGRRVVIVVDDVYEAIGLENVTRYTKSMYEWIKTLYEDYEVESVLIILTTSEGVSKRVLSRHTYAHVYMMWNLPRRGFEELTEQLSPPVSAYDLWLLTGGNPRALAELMFFEWNIDKWLSYIAESRVREALREVPPERVRAVVEDPDADPQIAEKLEDYGLMIELRRVMCLSEIPERCPDLGIGNEWAWQIPAYRLAVLRVLGR